ncbi:hypothetical protein SLA2020_095550 [Shorea laevis]
MVQLPQLPVGEWGGVALAVQRSTVPLCGPTVRAGQEKGKKKKRTDMKCGAYLAIHSHSNIFTTPFFIHVFQTPVPAVGNARSTSSTAYSEVLLGSNRQERSVVH